ncbi:hypothetical protein K439DRAFT_1617334 [Ramaria rubella]|nr:hypothetical protein K439DRAFT_1617334 [Ramaria rubella]
MQSGKTKQSSKPRVSKKHQQPLNAQASSSGSVSVAQKFHSSSLPTAKSRPHARPNNLNASVDSDNLELTDAEDNPPVSKSKDKGKGQAVPPSIQKRKQAEQDDDGPPAKHYKTTDSIKPKNAHTKAQDVSQTSQPSQPKPTKVSQLTIYLCPTCDPISQGRAHII